MDKTSLTQTPEMAESKSQSPEDPDEWDFVIVDLVVGRISAKTAAEMLVSLIFNGHLAIGVDSAWVTIMDAARKFPKHQEQLVDLIIEIAKMPIPKHRDGLPFVAYGREISCELCRNLWTSDGIH